MMSMAEGDALIAQIDGLDISDPEAAHGEADRLILDALPEEVRQAYVRLANRCSWWACA